MASHYDFALFLRRTDKGTILLLYVDDMIIIGDDLNGIQELKEFLSQEFEMNDLGHLNYFLGLEITHCTNGLYIIQAKYASELLSQAGLTNSKTVDTPIELNANLTPSRGKPLSNPSLYRCLVSQYLSTPRLTHYAAVLHSLQYLKGTLLHGLFYSAQSPLILHAFSNVDWAGDPTNRKSTTGYCFLLGSFLISWQSKKQTHLVRFSTEAEYCAFTDTTSELLWLRWLLKDLGVSTSSATSPLLLLFIVTTRVMIESASEGTADEDETLLLLPRPLELEGSLTASVSVSIGSPSSSSPGRRICILVMVCLLMAKSRGMRLIS
ncbi:uncharacterized mitochondrial protein AtMg00810-like [Quercus suber]|uniref:uncharacterized mitochondrial protein AtMg00810-like n=1 Tax=Quercus suber TaxID=58331 RepID=UPI0032DFA6A1